MPATAHLLTAEQVAEHLGTCRATVYNMLPKGLPSLKVGRCRRFRLADVERWLEHQSDNRTEPQDAA